LKNAKHIEGLPHVCTLLYLITVQLLDSSFIQGGNVN